MSDGPMGHETGSGREGQQVNVKQEIDRIKLLLACEHVNTTHQALNILHNSGIKMGEISPEGGAARRLAEIHAEYLRDLVAMLKLSQPSPRASRS